MDPGSNKFHIGKFFLDSSLYFVKLLGLKKGYDVVGYGLKLCNELW